ncbi:MAG: PLDc N-terminal domain-containing protein [Burkholderiales bacterium]
MGIEVGGIFGLLILVADIWAIIHIAQSGSSPGAKALWIVLVLLLPLLGLIIWFIAGPRSRKSAG